MRHVLDTLLNRLLKASLNCVDQILYRPTMSDKRVPKEWIFGLVGLHREQQRFHLSGTAADVSLAARRREQDGHLGRLRGQPSSDR